MYNIIPCFIFIISFFILFFKNVNILIFFNRKSELSKSSKIFYLTVEATNR